MFIILLAIGGIRYNISVFWGSWNASVLPIRKYKDINNNKNIAYCSTYRKGNGDCWLSSQYLFSCSSQWEDPWILDELIAECGLVCNFCSIPCMGWFHWASALKATEYALHPLLVPVTFPLTSGMYMRWL